MPGCENTSSPSRSGSLRRLAEHDNVVVKLSGLATELMTQVTSYEDWFAPVLEALNAYLAATADAMLSANAERVYGVRAASSADTHSIGKP
ncbi:hypothetical protein [Catenulispora rubra]|uniref:hypothetical protein n=1 Tax=Catenulispora rubra TaxID=280293 RepID=UPI00189258B9|nr:hypothetical protein [Catenulispora rubra]